MAAEIHEVCKHEKVRLKSYCAEKGRTDMEEKVYSVSEAVRLIGVESHVLRYWEEELQIEIGRTSQGHRIYSPDNIETFRQVKSLKDKGIQLKAIRVLLEEAAKPEMERQDTERDFVEKILEVNAAVQSDGEKEEMLETDRTDFLKSDTYEILCTEKKPDNLQQFEAILKQMIAEVVEEQNEKLKAAIADMIRDELEELYLQYYQLPMEEAAVVSEKKKQERGKGIWSRIWKRQK